MPHLISKASLHFLIINYDTRIDKFYNLIVEGKRYALCNTCVDYDDGQDVYNIVRQDDLQYPEDTFFHDPAQKITVDEFFAKTGLYFPTSNNFFGYNEDYDMLFRYNSDDDIHYFYK